MLQGANGNVGVIANEGVIEGTTDPNAAETDAEVYYEDTYYEDEFENDSTRSKTGRALKSIVWRYFVRSRQRPIARCEICKEQFKFIPGFKTGTTTHLRNHLKKVHQLTE